MTDSVTREQIQSARQADLYVFMLSHHADMVEKEGTSLKLRNNHSLSIRRGYCGYTDFETGEKGNSIDFLVKWLRYSFKDAVYALNGDTAHVHSQQNEPIQRDRGLQTDEPNGSSEETVATGKAAKPREHPAETTVSPMPKELVLPRMCHDPPVALREYLGFRGIPSWLSSRLMQRNLLYQEEGTRNIVFLSPEHDFFELRGTMKNRPFHQCQKTLPDRCWHFCSHLIPARLALICEGSIDAMSLFLLNHYRHEFDEVPVVYCGIGGVANYRTIDRIVSTIPTILAVDNDDAGAICRKRYPDLNCLIPKNKDWNEDLQAYLKISDASQSMKSN